MTTLKIAIQKSGRIAEKSIKLLKDAGFEFEIFERNLTAKCRNFPLEILFLRTNDIPEIINDQTADIGICGQNTLAEKNFPLQTIEKLGFGQCRLSIAINKTIPQPDPKKFLQNKRIATSYPKILKKYLDENNLKAKIIELSGSVEIAPKLNIADAICDLVSSGSTLKMNGLQELEQIFYSECVLVASPKIKKEKQEIFEKFLMRIRSVILAKKFKYVIFNLETKNLQKIKNILPGLESPTITNLQKTDWISVATVVEENIFWETIEKLKANGASGILVTPIEKMIL